MQFQWYLWSISNTPVYPIQMSFEINPSNSSPNQSLLIQAQPMGQNSKGHNMARKSPPMRAIGKKLITSKRNWHLRIIQGAIQVYQVS